MAGQPNEIGGNCWYCEKPIVRKGCKARRGKLLATVDHKIPRTRGGTDTDENKVPACISCNSSKGNRTAGEFVAMLFAGIKRSRLPPRSKPIYGSEMSKTFSLLLELVVNSIWPVKST